MQDSQIKITQEVLKQNLLKVYGTIPNKTNKTNPIHNDILVELSPTGLTIIGRDLNTCVVQTVGTKVENFEPTETQSFLIDTLLFNGFVKNIEVEKLKLDYDGTHLTGLTGSKKSKFLVKDSTPFFDGGLSWQQVMFEDKNYIKLPMETLKELHTGIKTTKGTISKEDNKPQLKAVEVGFNYLATTDERGHSRYKLTNPLPIPDDLRILIADTDYLDVEKAILSILNSGGSEFEIHFEESEAQKTDEYYIDEFELDLEDEESENYIKAVYIKDLKNTTFVRIGLMMYDVLDIENIIDEVVKDNIVFSFEVDYNDYLNLIKIYSDYENRALRSMSDNSHTHISISKGTLKAKINIEDITRFDDEIDVNILKGTEYTTEIKCTQLLKMEKALKDTGKIIISFKERQNELVLKSDVTPNLDYFITSSV